LPFLSTGKEVLQQKANDKNSKQNTI